MNFSFRSLFSNAEIFALTLILISLFILIVLFRMKSVEQDYAINTTTKSFQEVSFINKELKAKRAQAMSVDNLWKMAERHGFKKPGQNKVIIVAD